MSLLELKSVMLSNSEIAKSVTIKPITLKKLHQQMGINESDMIPLRNRNYQSSY